MFPFGPLHVLILYAWNRAAGIIEFDQGVYEEIQRRAAQIPPAQRQAAIDAMVKDRAAIGTEVMRRKKIEEARIRRRNRWIYLFYWLLAAGFIYYMVK